MTFKLFHKNKKVSNGGVMPEHEYLAAILEIPPTNYDELKKILKVHYPNNQLKTHYYCQSITEVSLHEGPILMNDRVQEIRKLIGKKWRVTPFTNLQEISISKIP